MIKTLAIVIVVIVGFGVLGTVLALSSHPVAPAEGVSYQGAPADRKPSPNARPEASRASRKAWAQAVDSTLLDAGIESRTSTYGPADTTLIIESALAGRVMAQKLGETSLPDAAKARGFKKLVLSDGDGREFVWELK